MPLHTLAPPPVDLMPLRFILLIPITGIIPLGKSEVDYLMKSHVVDHSRREEKAELYPLVLAVLSYELADRPVHSNGYIRISVFIEIKPPAGCYRQEVMFFGRAFILARWRYVIGELNQRCWIFVWKR